MTWSIIARDNSTGQFGIAVATNSSPSARACRISPPASAAIATQALVNPYYGIDGLKLLREGREPRDIVETLIAARRRAREPAASRHGRALAASLPIPGATASTGAGISRATAFRSPATCSPAPACSTIPRRPIVANAEPAVRATPDRGDARGRSRGRRQARQAIGGASDLRRGRMVRPRPARRRPCRSARRTRTAGSASAASAGCISGSSCRPAKTRPAITDRDIIDARIEAAIAAREMTASPLIEIEGLRVHLPRRRRPHHACGRQRRPRRRQRRDAGAGRRIRLRQERDFARHHGPVVETFGRSHRLDPFRRF